MNIIKKFTENLTPEELKNLELQAEMYINFKKNQMKEKKMIVDVTNTETNQKGEIEIY